MVTRRGLIVSAAAAAVALTIGGITYAFTPTQTESPKGNFTEVEGYIKEAYLSPSDDKGNFNYTIVMGLKNENKDARGQTYNSEFAKVLDALLQEPDKNLYTIKMSGYNNEVLAGPYKYYLENISVEILSAEAKLDGWIREGEGIVEVRAP